MAQTLLSVLLRPSLAALAITKIRTTAEWPRDTYCKRNSAERPGQPRETHALPPEKVHMPARLHFTHSRLRCDRENCGQIVAAPPAPVADSRPRRAQGEEKASSNIPPGKISPNSLKTEDITFF